MAKKTQRKKKKEETLLGRFLCEDETSASRGRAIVDFPTWETETRTPETYGPDEADMMKRGKAELLDAKNCGNRTTHLG